MYGHWVPLCVSAIGMADRWQTEDSCLFLITKFFQEALMVSRHLHEN